MQTDLRNCLHCKEEFHPITNAPRLLYTCGHTFCSQCIREIIDKGKCPLDSILVPPDTPAEQIPINSIILETLPALCPKHQKPEDLICLKEERRICSDCKDECEIKRHNVRVLRDVERETEETNRSLQAEEYPIEPTLIVPDVLDEEIPDNAIIEEGEAEENKQSLQAEECSEDSRHASSEALAEQIPGNSIMVEAEAGAEAEENKQPLQAEEYPFEPTLIVPDNLNEETPVNSTKEEGETEENKPSFQPEKSPEGSRHVPSDTPAEEVPLNSIIEEREIEEENKPSFQAKKPPEDSRHAPSDAPAEEIPLNSIIEEAEENKPSFQAEKPPEDWKYVPSDTPAEEIPLNSIMEEAEESKQSFRAEEYSQDSLHVPPPEEIPVENLPALCPRHHKPEDLICLKEYRTICCDCRERCLFQRHKIRILREVEEETEEKKQSLQAIADQLESKYEEIDTSLNEREEALTREVDSNFEALKKEIESTENQIHLAVRNFFEEQKKITGENHKQLKNQANDLLQILDQKSFDNQFFNALKTHLDIDIGSHQMSKQKPRSDPVVNRIKNHAEAIKVELMILLTRIPTLLTAKDHHSKEDLRIEDNEETLPTLTILDEEVPFEEEQPRIEEEQPAVNFQRVDSLFNAEIDEENQRLVLSLKTQKEDMETEEASLLDDQEQLQSIEKVTLQINRSPMWKEAIESLRWIWSKLGKVLGLNINFSFKTPANEILKVLLEQNNVWATHDLIEFAIDLSESQVHDKAVTQLYDEAISKMTHLQKLEIALENTKITEKSVKEFAEKILPHLRNLTDFRFYIDNTKVSDKTLEKLLAIIHHKKINLTDFALGLDGTAITDKTIKNLAKTISPLSPKLTKLDLSANNTNISDESLKALFESVHLNSLKEFTLDLGYTKISNEGFKLFAHNTLAAMRSLEVFELFLNAQHRVTNIILKPLAKSFLSLTNLKKICLELGGTETGGLFLDALEQYALKNKPLLETFELYVAETKIKDVEINNFFMKVEKEQDFKNLRTLCLSFSKLHVTDDGCELLAKSIQACEHLQVLKLQLGKTRITDTGLESLSQGINQALQRTKITGFQLYLDATAVRDKGFKVLSNQVVRNLIGVESFELCLTRVHGVTDHGVETLLADLSTVAGSLKNLDLYLHEMKITDDCLRVLSETLWSVKPDLESLTLSLGKNKCITDEGLEWCLTNFAGVLKSLKKLAFGIEGTKISQTGLGLLKDYLDENRNALEKIEVEVGEDYSLHKIVKDIQGLIV